MTVVTVTQVLGFGRGLVVHQMPAVLFIRQFVLSIDLEHQQLACERVPNFYHFLLRAVLLDPRGATNSMCVAVGVNKKASTRRHAM